MIEFHCKNCGQRLSVQETYAANKTKCPKCSSRVAIPDAPTTGAAVDRAIAGDTEPASKASPYDLTLLDVPQKIKAQSQPTERPIPDETAYEQLRGRQDGLVTQESDQIPQRKLPCIIDIFLYPINKPGLIMLGLIIAASLLPKLLLKILPWAVFAVPPLIIVAVSLVIVAYLIAVTVWLYFY